MISPQLAQPPGIRSCGNYYGQGNGGGTWEHACPVGSQRPYFIAELSDARRTFELSDTAWAFLVAEVEQLLKDAEAGVLNFDTTSHKGIVCQCVIRPNVLEMRLEQTVNFDGETYLLRIYFSEPEACDHTLISLSLRYKQPGQRGLVQQNEHIVQADHRLNDWLSR